MVCSTTATTEALFKVNDAIVTVQKFCDICLPKLGCEVSTHYEIERVHCIAKFRNRSAITHIQHASYTSKSSLISCLCLEELPN